MLRFVFVLSIFSTSLVFSQTLPFKYEFDDTNRIKSGIIQFVAPSNARDALKLEVIFAFDKLPACEDVPKIKYNENKSFLTSSRAHKNFRYDVLYNLGNKIPRIAKISWINNNDERWIIWEDPEELKSKVQVSVFETSLPSCTADFLKLKKSNTV